MSILELDALLGGGLPCGVVTEVVGTASSGKTTLVHLLVSAATTAGEFVAWIDLPNAFDPGCTLSTGVDFERVLWVRPRDALSAFRAAEHILVVGGFRFVVLDFDVPMPGSSTASASLWLRLVRAASRHDAAVVVLGRRQLPGTFAALSLEMSRCLRVFDRQGKACPVFQGLSTGVHLRKNKLGPPGTMSIDLFAFAAP